MVTSETACRAPLVVLSLESQASDVVLNAIVNTVKKFNFEGKIICFCGNNTNTNF